jgi:hypothetical protein
MRDGVCCCPVRFAPERAERGPREGRQLGGYQIGQSALEDGGHALAAGGTDRD